jgi:hypothetical protein
MYVHHKPSEISFDKVGIKGRIFPSQALSDKTQFAIIETEAGHETTIIEHKCDFANYITIRIIWTVFFKYQERRRVGRRKSNIQSSKAKLPWREIFGYRTNGYAAWRDIQ